MIFEVGQSLKVGYRGYLDCLSEPPMAVIAASVAALPVAGWKRSGRGLEVGTEVGPPESE